MHNNFKEVLRVFGEVEPTVLHICQKLFQNALEPLLVRIASAEQDILHAQASRPVFPGTNTLVPPPVLPQPILDDIGKISTIQKKQDHHEQVLGKFYNDANKEVVELKEFTTALNHRITILEGDNLNLRERLQAAEAQLVAAASVHAELQAFKRSVSQEYTLAVRFKDLSDQFTALKGTIRTFEEQARARTTYSLPVAPQFVDADAVEESTDSTVQVVPPPSSRIPADMSDAASPQRTGASDPLTSPKFSDVGRPLFGSKLSTPGTTLVAPPTDSLVLPSDPNLYTKFAKNFQPHWDGDPLTWTDFWAKWLFYWSLQAKSCSGDETVKKVIIYGMPSQE